jgi:NTE family protein
MRTAIVLTGGGARGAYQAGALRALFEIAKEEHRLDVFQNLVGISAGSINAAFLASRMDDLDGATARLCEMWRNIKITDVFRSDTLSFSKTGFKLLKSLTLGGFSGKLRSDKMGLLDTRPLNRLIEENTDFNQIERFCHEGRLESLCVTATDYATSINVTFFSGRANINDWTRHLRQSLRTHLSADHVMASTAIPIFFPPWAVRGRYFGDGCLRNTAPLSPAIHVGAEKIIVIGVRRLRKVTLTEEYISPSIGRILSVIINSVFMDSIDNDIERTEFVNHILKKYKEPQGALRPIELFYQTPSVTISDLAAEYEDRLPQMFRFLMGGLGSPKESSEILSYLTFVSSYCTNLIELGYSDLMNRKEKLQTFLRG